MRLPFRARLTRKRPPTLDDHVLAVGFAGRGGVGAYQLQERRWWDGHLRRIRGNLVVTALLCAVCMTLAATGFVMSQGTIVRLRLRLQADAKMLDHDAGVMARQQLAISVLAPLAEKAKACGR